MTARRLAAVVVLSAISVPGAQQAPPASQQPVFRSTLDVVTIDVSVRSGGTPVTGLTAKDFVLTDNGVRQAIESIEMEEVPAELTLLVDANEDVTYGERSFHEMARRMASMLRPRDRMRVTAINGSVRDVVSGPAAAVAHIGALPLRDLSAANDGLASALLRSPGDERRHLIIAMTNGVDAVSALSADTVREIARHAQAVLHVVQMDIAVEGPGYYTTGRERNDAARCGLSGLCAPTRNFWRPYDDKRDIDVLREAAESTGGALHLPGLFTRADDVFANVLRDYRRSYLLRYTPQGVAREGWHEVKVTVPGHSYNVQARRGYSIETTAPPAAKPAGTAWAPVSLASVIGAYSRGEYVRLESELARVMNLASLIGDFRKSGNPWPANPSKEAAFVIELAEAALRSRRAGASDAARDLLLEHRKLVRHPLGPDQFEKYWLWSLIASLQGAGHPSMTREFVDYALTRFPDEPRFVLARAVAADQARAFEAAEGRGGAGEAAHVRDVTARYDAAARFGETAAEAMVRKGLFLHRIGRHTDALHALDQVVPAQIEGELFLAYTHRLVRGRVLESLEKFDEARAAYQAARDALPNAQSPRVALMRLLMRAGDRPAAEALAASIQTASEEAFDPWWLYWLGDYRHYDAIRDRLRERTRS